MGIADDIRKILAIKIKPRQDSYSDQFSRVFLLKVMFLGAFFTGMDWYSDKIKCIIPKDQADGSFASSSCWINGVYVYENIRFHDNDVGYYGMPRDITFNGMLPNGKLCETFSSTINVLNKRINKDCKPMEKTFFLQYQYMTFFLVLLGALYYAPYTFFKYVNTDVQSLKKSIKSGSDAKYILETFFNHRINSPFRMNFRIIGTIVTKLLYIIVNVLAFVLTNRVLHGNFQSYGTNYAKWTTLNNSMAYDYMGQRHSPKPGDVLLPSFAFCEVSEMAADIKNQFHNKNRFVCEMSQHILYQYVFILIWWAMVFGIIVSVFGLIMVFLDYAFTLSKIKKTIPGYSGMSITIRECEYLAYIRRKNLPLFGNVLREMKNERNLNGKNVKAPPYES